MSIPNNGAPASNEATSLPNPDLSIDDVNEVSDETQEESAVDLADVQAVVADPSASKSEKAAAKKMIKSLKLKVDGKEYDEELPFEIDEDPKKIEWLQKHLQLSKVSQKRMQEKAESENEIRAFIEALRNNPEEVLSNPHINVNLKEFATKIIEREIENEKKSPEQRRSEELEAKLKKIEEEQKKEKESQKQREMERMNQEAIEKYDMLLEQAFTKHPELPKTPWAVKRISDYMVLALQNGIDANPEDVIPLVLQDRKEEFKQLASSANDDMLEDLLSKERLNAYRKKKVADAKRTAATNAGKVLDTGKKTEKQEDANGKRQTIRGFFGV